MSNINLPMYDLCRKWIKDSRDREVGWNEIKFARRQNHEGLEEFLHDQRENNYWPTDLNTALWFQIVKSEQEAEDKSLEVEEKKKAAVLTDEKEDSEVIIPLSEASSWQLYRKHLSDSGWQEDSIKEIESATIKTLKRLSRSTETTGPIKGLIVGYVQSGKTANMAALMAMAADWGWNFFIVLSGTVENLRKQTQSRLFRDLNRPGALNWTGLEHLSLRSPMGQRSQDLRLEESSVIRYFTVCLKNSKRIKDLIQWMRKDSNKLLQMKIILIDDEADQASINTASIVNAEERKTINSLIVKLVSGEGLKKDETFQGKPLAMNYISYTATPYANVLNESAEESLYPRNFIRTLNPSNEYFGPKQIFGIEGSDYCDGLNIIREITSDDLNELKLIHKGDSLELPDSFKDSLCWFLCAASAMRIYGYKKPISMLVHTSQTQDHHKNVADALSGWLKTVTKEKLLYDCERVWFREVEQFGKDAFREAFPEYGRPDELIREYPMFRDIEPGIKILLRKIDHIPLGEDGELKYHESIHLCIDNCAKNEEQDVVLRLYYPDPDSEKYPEPAPAFIVVGGNTLSRGLTIEGLISTYFLRSSCQADSLMQMGRWFGYRQGYEMLPRIWMTRDTLEKFQFLAVLEDELRQDLYDYMLLGKSPLEYGPRVKNTPKASWLRITAKNKMQGAVEVDLDFTGTRNQTIHFSPDVDILKKNIEITNDFLNKLGECETSFMKSCLVWRDIAFNEIGSRYLRKFEFHKRSRVFNQIDDLCDWVDGLCQENPEHEFSKWNIIVAGTGKIETGKMNKGWVIQNKYSIGKVVRSRKRTGDSEVVNIGVLRGPVDQLADIKLDKLSSALQKRIIKARASEVDNLRKEARMDRIPQLIIYRIDKDSKERKTKSENPLREDLNVQEDIVGICINLPGVQKGQNLSRKLTINLNDKDFFGEEE